MEVKSYRSLDTFLQQQQNVKPHGTGFNRRFQEDAKGSVFMK